MSITLRERISASVPARVRLASARVTGSSTLRVPRGVLARYFANDQPIYAAALAYGALFALFPALLLILWFASFFFPSPEGYKALLDRLLAIPGAGPLLARSFEAVFAQRNQLGLIGLVGLVFGSFAPVSVAEAAVNRAWGCPPRRGVHRWRWLLPATFSLLGFLGGSTLIVTLVFRLLGRYLSVPGGGNRSLAVSLALFVIVSLGLFLLGYRFLPNRRTRWSEIVPGALFATALWFVLADGLTIYLVTFGDPTLRFGALAPVMAILIWSYALASVFSLGVELAVHVSSNGPRSPN